MTMISLLYNNDGYPFFKESYDQRLLVSLSVFYLTMSNHLLFFRCILSLQLMNHFLFPFFFGTSLPDLLCPPILLLFNPTQHYSVGYYCYLHWYRCCYCCSWYPLILIGNCANSFSAQTDLNILKGQGICSRCQTTLLFYSAILAFMSVADSVLKHAIHRTMNSSLVTRRVNDQQYFCIKQALIFIFFRV